MADKGRWSIVNPSGEELTFVSRDELRQAVLDDDIEPHAESIPPELHSDSLPAAPNRKSRPTPETTDPSVSALRPSSDGAIPSEGKTETDDAIESAPVGEGEIEAEMDEPTLQFARPLSVAPAAAAGAAVPLVAPAAPAPPVAPAAPSLPSIPPAPSRHSPPEDEGSPLSLSEVGGDFAPPSQDAQSVDTKSARLKNVDRDDEDEKTVQDFEVDPDAIEDDDDQGPPETPKHFKGTPPPPLPSGDRRSSKPSMAPRLPSIVPTLPSIVPPFPSKVPPRSSIVSATHVGPSSASVIISERHSLTPRGSVAPERARITATSLPPPDIIPDAGPDGGPMARASSPRLTDSGLYAPPEGHKPERHAVAPAAPAPVAAASASEVAKRKSSWIIPLTLVGIGLAFWLGSKFNQSESPYASKAATAAPPVATETAATTSAPPDPAPPDPAPDPSAAASASSAAPAEPEVPAASSAPPAAPESVVAPTPPPVSAVTSSAPAATADKPHPTPTPSVTTPPTTPATAAPRGEEPIGPLLRKAAGIMRNGDYGSARQLYQSLLAKDPKNPEVLSGLGDTSRALGDKAGARSYYVRALDASSSFLPALLGLADTEWDLGERAGAQKHYIELVERQPNAPERARQRAKGLGGP